MATTTMATTTMATTTICPRAGRVYTWAPAAGGIHGVRLEEPLPAGGWLARSTCSGMTLIVEDPAELVAEGDGAYRAAREAVRARLLPATYAALVGKLRAAHEAGDRIRAACIAELIDERYE